MNVKIHSNELNRMMRTLSRCIDGKLQGYGNIEITYDSNELRLRGTNGQFSAVMTSPVMGGDGESFCVDGEVFAKVCGQCKGEMDISTNGNSCVIRGAGRTRLPIVNENVPAFVHPENGLTARMQAQDFQRAYAGVEHAIAADNESRLVLTGVKMEIGGITIRMAALDGFRLAVEETECVGTEMNMIVPGSFVKLIKDSVVAGEEIRLTSDGNRIMAQTDGMMISCPLLGGEFPDYERILPKNFETECRVQTDTLRTVLKNSAVICNNSKLVKLEIQEDSIRVSGNSEAADYEAEVPCETAGKTLTIAFNQKYVMDMINSLCSETVTLKMNTPSMPCVAQGTDGTGVRLLLPVRTVG